MAFEYKLDLTICLKPEITPTQVQQALFPLLQILEKDIDELETNHIASEDGGSIFTLFAGGDGSQAPECIDDVINGLLPNLSLLTLSPSKILLEDEGGGSSVDRVTTFWVGPEDLVAEAHGRELREQAAELLQQAVKIDGKQPFIVGHEHKYGTSFYVAWSAKESHQFLADDAEKVLMSEFEPELNESLVVEPLDLEKMLGVEAPVEQYCSTASKPRG